MLVIGLPLSHLPHHTYAQTNLIETCRGSVVYSLEDSAVGAAWPAGLALSKFHRDARSPSIGCADEPLTQELIPCPACSQPSFSTTIFDLQLVYAPQPPTMLTRFTAAARGMTRLHGAVRVHSAYNRARFVLATGSTVPYIWTPKAYPRCFSHKSTALKDIPAPFAEATELELLELGDKMECQSK